jgi:hypothetical protein
LFEAERQAYLKALGIVQYVPREPLPGAPESPVLTDADLFPPVSAEPGGEADVSQQIPDRSPSDVPLVDQEAAGDARDTPATTSAADAPQAPSLSAEGITVNIPQALLEEQSSDRAQPKAARNQSADADTVAFCFALLRGPGGVAILVELGDAGVKDMSAQEHRLVGDILVALQMPPDQTRPMYFKWPLVNNPKIRQGWAEARETLLSYLDEKLGDAGVSTLVLLGDVPGRVLQIENHQLPLGSGTLVVVHAPAPQAMLSDWRYKARAWRMPAPLRGRHL